MAKRPTPHTHAHYGDNNEEYIFVGKNKGYDEFAYDALIGILGGIASWKYGAERIEKKYRQILARKGQKDGEAHYAITPVKKIDRHLAPGSKATIVQLPSFDEFIEKHGDYLKLMLLEEILSKSPKRLPKDEEKKIEKTIEIAIDAAKKLAEMYGNPEKLVHVGLMEINHAKDALSTLEFLNPEKSPLEVIGDHIIELKKMHPEVVKPEKVYGKEWYEFLKKKGIDPKTLEPVGKKPTFPKMKEQVEEELRKAGVPEQQIKVVAPRLAAAVWLENQIRALKESSTARLYGGVPVAELRNLREKVLAKKHVAEKAAEIIENYWMKGTIVPIKEEHLDPKMLPFVREHASGMMEDIRNLAERVKNGELDPQDVRTILAVERDLLDRTHEAIEKTMGSPENLMENRRAYGVEDKFMVKREALEKMHRELKPHFETARVRVFIRGGTLEFKGL